MASQEFLQKQTHVAADRYKVWINQAKFDLVAAEGSFGDNNYEWACYQSVQSVEKALKAVIVHAGWRPPQTHKLGILLSMCNHANRLFEGVKFNYRKLESYTFIARYPFVYPGEANLSPHELINRQDASTCVQIAMDIINKVIRFLDTGAIEKAGAEMDLEHIYFTNEEIQKRLDGFIKLLKSDKTIDVEKVVLFGSFAREKTRPRTSTMDVLIVAETSLPFIQRIEYIRNLTKGGEPMIEPLVYTKKEFDFMLIQEGEGFLESAIDEGRVVYEKAPGTN